MFPILPGDWSSGDAAVCRTLALATEEAPSTMAPDERNATTEQVGHSRKARRARPGSETLGSAPKHVG